MVPESVMSPPNEIARAIHERNHRNEQPVKNRTLGVTALLAVLLGSAACGTEKVSDTDPGSVGGFGARPHPSTDAKGSVSMSADAAERKAAADKARRDKAAAARYDHSVR